MKFKSEVQLEALNNATVDTDKFLVSDSTTVKYRTGSEVLSDIGGQAALTNPITGTGTLNYVSKFTGTTTLGNSQIFDNGTNVGIGTPSPSGKLSILDFFYNTFFSDTSSQYGSGLILSGDAGGGVQKSWKTFAKNGNGAVALTFDVSTNGTSYGSSPTGLTYSEKMRITPDGNVGIGTSSPASILHLYKTSYPVLTIGSGTVTGNTGIDTSGNFMSFGTQTNHDVSFATNNTPRMRITSAGNVGIGTASPGVKFVNSGGPFSSGPTLGSAVEGSQALLSNNGLYGMYSGVSSNGDVWHQVQRNDANTAVYNLALQPSGGNIYIGTNAPVYGTSSKMQFLFNGLAEFGINFRSTAVSSIPIHFTSSTGTQTGYIFQDATSVSLVSVSDYRLKEDLKTFNGLDLISKINVYDYKWKDQDKRSFGVMAHELQDVVPQAAFGEKDGDKMQGVDYSTLVPILIQAIQDQQKQIDELKKLIE